MVAVKKPVPRKSEEKRRKTKVSERKPYHFRTSACTKPEIWYHDMRKVPKQAQGFLNFRVY